MNLTGLRYMGAFLLQGSNKMCALPFVLFQPEKKGYPEQTTPPYGICPLSQDFTQPLSGDTPQVKNT